MDPKTKRLIGRLTLPVVHLSLGMLIACLPACNTVEGAGEDIEEAGDAIDDAAEDASD